jgi:predicted amidohydrolase
MILAAAQINPADGNEETNLDNHYKLIHLAASHGAGFITFPEMSLTGYLRKGASEVSYTEEDVRLDTLKKLSAQYHMVIVAGAPIKLDSGLHIGSFVLFPDYSVSIYTKQFLHDGEEVYFVPGADLNPVIELGRERISLAICADINHQAHVENAKTAGSTFYIPGIFYSAKGMEEAYNVLSQYASRYAMHILMSNFHGNAWGMEAGGKSAFWSDQGELVLNLDTSNTGLILAEKCGNKWTARSLVVDEVFYK